MRSTALIIAGALAGASLPAVARADVGAVIVVGKAQDRVMETVQSTAKQAALDQAWTLIYTAFDQKEISAIVGCLSVDRPWSCVAPTVNGRNIKRLIVVRVNPERGERGNELAIVGQLVAADGVAAPIERQYCDASCPDAKLIDATNHVMHALFKDASTAKPPSHVASIEIHTVPPGARVLIDDKPAGTSDRTVSTSPGRHEITLQLAGHQTATRYIDLAAGKTASIDETLVPLALAAPAHGRDEGHPHLVPGVVIGVGAAALVAGIALQATASAPPLGQDQPAHIYSGPGIGLSVAGGLAVAAGVYLWLRASHHREASVPTAALRRGGAVVGWSGSF